MIHAGNRPKRVVLGYIGLYSPLRGQCRNRAGNQPVPLKKGSKTGPKQAQNRPKPGPKRVLRDPVWGWSFNDQRGSMRGQMASLTKNQAKPQKGYIGLYSPLSRPWEKASDSSRFWAPTRPKGVKTGSKTGWFRTRFRSSTYASAGGRACARVDARVRAHNV